MCLLTVVARSTTTNCYFSSQERSTFASLDAWLSTGQSLVDSRLGRGDLAISDIYWRDHWLRRVSTRWQMRAIQDQPQSAITHTREQQFRLNPQNKYKYRSTVYAERCLLPRTQFNAHQKGSNYASILVTNDHYNLLRACYMNIYCTNYEPVILSLF